MTREQELLLAVLDAIINGTSWEAADKLGEFERHYAASTEPTPARPTGEGRRCKCGHKENNHVYHVGACRTGLSSCPCERFEPAPAKDEHCAGCNECMVTAQPNPVKEIVGCIHGVDLLTPGARCDACAIKLGQQPAPVPSAPPSACRPFSKRCQAHSDEPADLDDACMADEMNEGHCEPGHCHLAPSATNAQLQAARFGSRPAAPPVEPSTFSELAAREFNRAPSPPPEQASTAPARERRCQCQWEPGDSPCRVHGEDEEVPATPPEAPKGETGAACDDCDNDRDCNRPHQRRPYPSKGEVAQYCYCYCLLNKNVPHVRSTNCAEPLPATDKDGAK